jgi:hypothetical protein
MLALHKPANFMKIQPVSNRILIRFHFPDPSDIILPNSKLSAEFGDKNRTKVEVMAVGPDVKTCKAGDFVMLLNDAERNLIPTSKEPAEGLIDASVVIAITDDVRPIPKPQPNLTVVNGTPEKPSL